MDGELIFLVQGNPPDPFRVSFIREGKRLSATCTCNAGLLGKLCKHRLGLMKGDPTGLVGGSVEQVPLIQELFKDTEGEPALKGLLEAEACETALAAIPPHAEAVREARRAFPEAGRETAERPRRDNAVEVLLPILAEAFPETPLFVLGVPPTQDAARIGALVGEIAGFSQSARSSSARPTSPTTDLLSTSRPPAPVRKASPGLATPTDGSPMQWPPATRARHFASPKPRRAPVAPARP